MIGLSERARYVSAMMEAIDVARTCPALVRKLATKTNGLRVIKRFEKVNGYKFDPFNDEHVQAIAGHGYDEAFFRSVKLKGQWLG